MTDIETNVTLVGNCYLVRASSEHTTWEVTVSPDAMIRLPQLVRPQDIEEFCAVMMAAQPVALELQAKNLAAQAAQEAEREEQREARERAAREREVVARTGLQPRRGRRQQSPSRSRRNNANPTA